jgi:deoxyribodipyrimidine photo-lyase
MDTQKPVGFWFRRDLRLDDNTALLRALESGAPVLPAFVFDRNILDALEDPDDARVSFLHQRMSELDAALRKYGSTLLVGYGNPLACWKTWQETYGLQAVYANRDYEPYARTRDPQVDAMLRERGAELRLYKDQVLFEQNEVVKPDGQPYSVFTPYSRRWKAALAEDPPKARKLPARPRFLAYEPLPMPSLELMRFRPSTLTLPDARVSDELLRRYAVQRNLPAEAGTSRLGLHLRFGTISIRRLLEQVLGAGSEVFLNELIWREFYQMILFHHPRVVSEAFKPAYDRIPWRDDPQGLERWKSGNTGYPLVDAGMRELAQTGFMHNRVRMVTASFLTKHLLIDWRLGEAWFARKLLDFELASNNGGWQWAAGSGCDAAPYFRVFNPLAQAKKFDPELRYIRRWVPEWGSAEYPEPMVEHTEARQRVLQVFQQALSSA